MITDTEARRIASEWRDGSEVSALFAFNQTGAIEPRFAGEIEQTLGKNTGAPCQIRQLQTLLVYVNHHGARGPIVGWET